MLHSSNFGAKPGSVLHTMLSLLQQTDDSVFEETDFERLQRDVRYLNFHDFNILVDGLLNLGPTVTFQRLKVLKVVISNAHRFHCTERNSLILKLWVFFRDIPNDGVNGPCLFPIFDLLAASLHFRCPSLSSDLSQVGKYVQSAVGCLQSSTIPTSTDHLQSVLNFILALCKHCVNTFLWMNILPDFEASGGLAFRLLLTVVTIEIKLRLPANSEAYKEVNEEDETMLSTCLELLSLIITEIVTTPESDEEGERTSSYASSPSKSVAHCISDANIGDMFKQLIDLNALLSTSLNPGAWDPEQKDDTTASSWAVEPTVLMLRVFAVHLQWLLGSSHSKLISIPLSDVNQDFLLAFDAVAAFQPRPPLECKEYAKLEAEFENKNWCPLLPLLKAVVKKMFQTVNADDDMSCCLGLCRNLILRLARCFPAVFVRSFPMDFFSCFSNSAERNASLDDSLESVGYLCDLSTLLNIRFAVDSDPVGPCESFLRNLIDAVVKLSPALQEPFKILSARKSRRFCNDCKTARMAKVTCAFAYILILLRNLLIAAKMEEITRDTVVCALLSEPARCQKSAESVNWPSWLAKTTVDLMNRMENVDDDRLLHWMEWPLWSCHPLLRGFYGTYTVTSLAEAVRSCVEHIDETEVGRLLLRNTHFVSGWGERGDRVG